jgi:putative Mn2+ efflux pump MntP
VDEAARRRRGWSGIACLLAVTGTGFVRWCPMLAILLVAASLGLSNFAAAIAIGVSGVDARTRLRVGIVFGLFEVGMPLLGLLLGHGLAGTLGHAARWIGAALLIATGLYALIQAFRHRGGDPASAASQGLGKLLVSGLALSIDNLAVGFALGTYHVALLTAAVLIGAVSVTMALAGLELGRLLGTKIGERGEALGGIVLIGVGIAIATGLL